MQLGKPSSLFLRWECVQLSKQGKIFVLGKFELQAAGPTNDGTRIDAEMTSPQAPPDDDPPQKSKPVISRDPFSAKWAQIRSKRHRNSRENGNHLHSGVGVELRDESYRVPALPHILSLCLW